MTMFCLYKTLGEKTQFTDALTVKQKLLEGISHQIQLLNWQVLHHKIIMFLPHLHSG